MNFEMSLQAYVLWGNVYIIAHKDSKPYQALQDV